MQAKDIKFTNASDKVVNLSGVLVNDQLQLGKQESKVVKSTQLTENYSEILNSFTFIKVETVTSSTKPAAPVKEVKPVITEAPTPEPTEVITPEKETLVAEAPVQSNKKGTK